MENNLIKQLLVLMKLKQMKLLVKIIVQKEPKQFNNMFQFLIKKYKSLNFLQLKILIQSLKFNKNRISMKILNILIHHGRKLIRKKV